MGRLVRNVGICMLIAVLFWCGSLIGNRQLLRRELVRLHVVGASDSGDDQAVKLQVKDAVVSSLRRDMAQLTNADEARAYLMENLPKIEALANRVLKEAGSTDTARATLDAEKFPARVYDTFSLPAGIYDALRITIGQGQGQNWWCVAFPSLCLPATTEGFEEVASCAGFPDALTAALGGEDGYEIRFYFLDLLGRLENLLS